MVKGWGMAKGDGQGKGMEKRRGMVKGRAYLGPRHCSLGVLDPCHCLCACVSQSCRHWAMSPHHRVWCGRVVILCWCRVVVGPCRLLVVIAYLVMLLLWLVLFVSIVVLSLSHHCVVSSSLPSHIIVMPRVVLYLSKVCWEEWGMRGAHHGVLAMTMNDVVVRRLVAMSLTVMWHLDLMSEK